MTVITYEKLIASSVERGNDILLKILHGTSKPGRPPPPSHHFDFGVRARRPPPTESFLVSPPGQKGR